MRILAIRKRFYIDVLYYIPQSVILQEFLWETEDEAPKCPRIHQFLNYWRSNLDAKIHTINICSSDGEYKFTKDEFRL